jgi:hypothetical protein
MIRSLREYKHNFTYLTHWVAREKEILYLTRDDEPWLKVCHLSEEEKTEMRSQLSREKKKRKYSDGY